MFDGVDRFIAERLSERGTVRFVFPSQVAADFRLRRALDRGPFRALRKELFWSWDTFKEKSFDEARRERPVNGAVRMLFAAALLEENARSSPPLFRRLVPADYSELSRSYRSVITAVLPRLEGLLTALENPEARAVFPAPFLDDAELLAARYRRFLSERGLFEPGSSIPEPEPLPGRTFIFFPGLIEDYAEYGPALDRCSWVTVVPADDLLSGEGGERPLLRYPRAGAELAALMDEITRLLREGTDPREIAITLPDREEWRERLAAAAADRSIPLQFRGGDPLSDTVPGRFFRALWETVSGDWELEKTSRLLLDRGIPWRSDGILRRIVRFGRDHFCHRGARLWDQRLERAGKPVLGSAFRRLREGAALLTGAESFAQLKERMQPFLRTHLETDAWSGDDLPVLQRCLEALSDLAEAEAAAGLGPAGAVFPLWLSYLDTKQYVRRRQGGGIPVYQYRVSAGISPLHHFIPGCGQEKSRVVIRRFPFLPEALRKSLPGSERDLSAPFIDAYSRAGSGACFSFSDEGFGGPDLPPSELIDRETEAGPPAGKDPFREELLYWRGELLPGTLWPEQKAGAARFFRSGGAGKRSDYTRDTVSAPDLVGELQNSLKGRKSVLEISPSLLGAFHGCPFAFYADRCLKAREPELEVRYSDPRITGTLFHSAAAEFFGGEAGRTPLFSRSAGELQSLMADAVEKVLRRWRAGREPVPLAPVADSIGRQVAAGAAALAAAHLEQWGAYRSSGTELLLEREPEGALSGIKIVGRLDWMGRADAGYLVVDFKKNLRLKKNDLLPPGGDLWPADFQIAFYLVLAEPSYGTVSAAYFDMTKGSYTVVCGEGEKPWFDGGERRLLVELLMQAVAEMTERLDRGDFRTAEEPCDGCGLRGACRERFHIRDVQ